ncbi:hypothetical protein I6N98_01510 [Spongiibacter nanhainus]|uniref:AtuA-like ferredoxin-fold domain-containing protein n=1 Tax=Spongiibacter nanhainus TaxID=2794344 RepID=A0A7T4R193_9GAMM|nr:hypothetical protein [Spongiibacter nanhainus]QQD18581.1 hypothetical protein I6N98_01510 [Spongiibacter nanhainus]
MPTVRLMDIAVARSGDKGNSSNIGVIAKSRAVYDFLSSTLTADSVKSCLSQICLGGVTRYELPKLLAFNFILEDSLRGGGSQSLIVDAQGKVHGLALLHMELDVPEELWASIDRESH